VTNLVRNATKYGFINTKIYVDARSSNNEEGVRGIEFVVTNYGIPIPGDEQEKIFKLGYRAKTARELDAQNSIGFGLCIVRKAATQHGGTVELVESTKISDICLPIVNAFKKLKISHFDDVNRAVLQKLKDICEEEEERIKSENPGLWRHMMAETSTIADLKIINEPTPRFYIDQIKQPTARVTFRLWVPLK
jgi:signal transduction histidine kinase